MSEQPQALKPESEAEILRKLDDLYKRYQSLEHTATWGGSFEREHGAKMELKSVVNGMFDTLLILLRKRSAAGSEHASGASLQENEWTTRVADNGIFIDLLDGNGKVIWQEFHDFRSANRVRDAHNATLSLPKQPTEEQCKKAAEDEIQEFLASNHHALGHHVRKLFLSLPKPSEERDTVA